VSGEDPQESPIEITICYQVIKSHDERQVQRLIDETNTEYNSAYRESEAKHEADRHSLIVLGPHVDDGHGEGLPKTGCPEPSITSCQKSSGEKQEPKVVCRPPSKLDGLQVGRVLTSEVKTENEAEVDSSHEKTRKDPPNLPHNYKQPSYVTCTWNFLKISGE
jgi:hypothetical protein